MPWVRQVYHQRIAAGRSRLTTKRPTSQADGAALRGTTRTKTPSAGDMVMPVRTRRGTCPGASSKVKLRYSWASVRRASCRDEGAESLQGRAVADRDRA
jgi:hypothetical protein